MKLIENNALARAVHTRENIDGVEKLTVENPVKEELIFNRYIRRVFCCFCRLLLD